MNIEDVKAMIRERAKDHGIIITDHNYEAISSVADNLFVIADAIPIPSGAERIWCGMGI